MRENTQTIFLIGVGRSGTTAMAELLNKHEDVCIGIERYKFKFLRRGHFEGNEFHQDRFFDFQSSDTNIMPKAAGKWHETYDHMASKFAHARIRGDKIPHLFERMDEAAAAFPQARWIYMLRDIGGVASSWNARAANPRDKWPKKNDYRAAVEVWNRANLMIRRRLARAAARPDEPALQLHVVSYGDFFSGDPAAYDGLLKFIGAPDTADFRACAEASFAKYNTVIRAKQPLILPGQAEFMNTNADRRSYRALLAITRGTPGPAPLHARAAATA